jgi:hypothetical protein
LEALNGWILFGLSTAFLYAMIQDAWMRLRADAVEGAIGLSGYFDFRNVPLSRS